MWSYLEITVNRDDGEYAVLFFFLVGVGIKEEDQRDSKSWAVKSETFWQYLSCLMKI